MVRAVITSTHGAILMHMKVKMMEMKMFLLLRTSQMVTDEWIWKNCHCFKYHVTIARDLVRAKRLVFVEEVTPVKV